LDSPVIVHRSCARRSATFSAAVHVFPVKLSTNNAAFTPTILAGCRPQHEISSPRDAVAALVVVGFYLERAMSDAVAFGETVPSVVEHGVRISSR